MNISRNILLLLSFFTAISFSPTISARDYTNYVDTRMGTDSRFEFSRGNTYPGTGRPFGMHLWSPQTGLTSGGWKYTWNADLMRGFTLSHQCSPWVSDYASISLFPVIGEPSQCSAASRGTEFRHSRETARPDYYAVTFDNGISTELSPTDRCCIFRFRFPHTGEASTVILDLCGYHGEFIAKGNDCLRGRLDVTDVHHHPLTSHFTIKFSVPFEKLSSWEEGGESGAYVTFPAGSEVEVKIGTSYISPEQAQLNLEREIGDRSFNRICSESRKVWNELLGRIDVRGGREEDMRTFYTCLYRANLNSRIFYELDGNGEPYYYSPFDFTVHTGYMYADNGFWDTYRAQFPLFNILHPTQQGRYMKVLMDIYDQIGWLPTWYQPFEMGGMTGNHCISLLADAWAKGIRTVDPNKVLAAYTHDITAKGPYWVASGRLGFSQYWDLGYVPYPEIRYGTTITQEYSYDDWCGLVFARETEDSLWIRKLEESSKYYKNTFNPRTGFMQGRREDGSWLPDFRPGAWGGPFEEGNAWHYSFSAVHDIPGMIDLHGGAEAFCSKLDTLFNTTALIDFGHYTDIWNEMVEMVAGGMGQYNHGNQPCHHIPYLYVYGGQPWKAQRRLRQIMTRLYKCAPDGYPGDDDQGAMSAWYVLSALGIYSICPGSSEYVLGSPLFEKAVVTLEDGRKFTVIAEGNNEESVYATSPMWDSAPLDGFFMDHSQLIKGGTLKFKMTCTPTK